MTLNPIASTQFHGGPSYRNTIHLSVQIFAEILPNKQIFTEEESRVILALPKANVLFSLANLPNSIEHLLDVKVI